MCRVAAGQEVEGSIGKGPALGRRLDRLDVGKTFFACRVCHRGQHLAREVRGGNPRRVARHQVGDMAAARAEVERMPGPVPRNDGVERLEIGALRVNDTLDISLGAWPELGLHDAIVIFCHGRILRSSVPGSSSSRTKLAR